MIKRLVKTGQAPSLVWVPFRVTPQLPPTFIPTDLGISCDKAPGGQTKLPNPSGQLDVRRKKRPFLQAASRPAGGQTASAGSHSGLEAHRAAHSSHSWTAPHSDPTASKRLTHDSNLPEFQSLFCHYIPWPRVTLAKFLLFSRP